jgi:hypothetical protein
MRQGERKLKFSMPVDDSKKLARELLEHLFTTSGESLSRNLFELLTDAAGYPLPVYGGESNEGLGAFECTFWPLPAFERIVQESRQRVSDFVLTGRTPAGEKERVRLGDRFNETALENFARVLAVNAGFALLATMNAHLTAAFEDNFDEAMLSGTLAFSAFFSEELMKGGAAWNPTINPHDDIETLANKAAERRRGRLRRLSEPTPYVTPPPKVGAPPKVTEARVRELLRRHGKVTAERAAELLECSPRAVKEWGSRTPQGTWAKARAALLAGLK